MYKETLPIMANHSAIAQIHVIDCQWKKEGPLRQLEQEYALAQTLRARHYDLVINLTQSMAQRNYNAAQRRSFLWHLGHNRLVATANNAQRHTVDLSILEPLNLAITDRSCNMYYTAADKIRGETLLRQQRLTGDYIIIQPTSRWLYKRWDNAKMAQLIKGLATSWLPMVLTAAPDKKEQEMVDHIISLCRGVKPVSLAGQLSIPQTGGGHRGLHTCLSASILRPCIWRRRLTPCVALFGPTKLQRWRPWSEIEYRAVGRRLC